MKNSKPRTDRKTKPHRLVEFIKYCNPEDTGKWWNRDEYRRIFVNPDDISYVERDPYHDDSTLIHLRSGHMLEVETDIDETVQKLN